MVAHAFFKGLLFLGAGSVIHGLHDEQDLKRMGALRRYMPWTFVTFAIGWLAIAGIPPLSGFWAKGDVLDNACRPLQALWVIGPGDGRAHRLLHEPPRRSWPSAASDRCRRRAPADLDPAHAHTPTGHRRAPRVALGHALPAVVLAFFAAVAGVLDLPWVQPRLAGQLARPGLRRQPLRRQPERRPPCGPWPSPTPSWPSSAWSSACACGAATRSDQPALEPPFLQRVWYWDDFYDTVIGRPGQRLAAFCAGWSTPAVIDGAVNGVAAPGPRLGRRCCARSQTGYVRNYAAGHRPRRRASSLPSC